MVAAQLAIKEAPFRCPSGLGCSVLAREPHSEVFTFALRDVIRCVIRDAVILLPLAQCICNHCLSVVTALIRDNDQRGGPNNYPIIHLIHAFTNN